MMPWMPSTLQRVPGLEDLCEAKIVLVPLQLLPQLGVPRATFLAYLSSNLLARLNGGLAVLEYAKTVVMEVGDFLLIVRMVVMSYGDYSLVVPYHCICHEMVKLVCRSDLVLKRPPSILMTMMQYFL